MRGPPPGPAPLPGPMAEVVAQLGPGWSLTTLAQALGVSRHTVLRLNARPDLVTRVYRLAIETVLADADGGFITPDDPRGPDR